MTSYRNRKDPVTLSTTLATPPTPTTTTTRTTYATLVTPTERGTCWKGVLGNIIVILWTVFTLLVIIGAVVLATRVRKEEETGAQLVQFVEIGGWIVIGVVIIEAIIVLLGFLAAGVMMMAMEGLERGAVTR